jgi:hypothetical protein
VCAPRRFRSHGRLRRRAVKSRWPSLPYWTTFTRTRFPAADGRDGQAYDNNRICAECDERGCAAIIRLRKGQPERNLRIPRDSHEWRRLYRRRPAVEREFGFLKHHFGLAAIRVRGIERVPLHADLIVLAPLAQAVSRARAMPLAA